MVILNIKEDLYNGCPHEMEGGEKIDICKICKGILIIEINKDKDPSMRESLEELVTKYINLESNLEKQVEIQPLKQKKIKEKQLKLLNMFIQRKNWIIQLINNTNSINTKMFLFERGYFYINEKIVLYSNPVRNCSSPSYYDSYWNMIQNLYDKLVSEENNN